MKTAILCCITMFMVTARASDLEDELLYQRMATEDVAVALRVQNADNAALIKCQDETTALKAEVKRLRIELSEAVCKDWKCFKRVQLGEPSK